MRHFRRFVSAPLVRRNSKVVSCKIFNYGRFTAPCPAILANSQYTHSGSVLRDHGLGSHRPLLLYSSAVAVSDVNYYGLVLFVSMRTKTKIK